MVTDETELRIVGGGPAGMMAGFLFARAGVRTLVLDKHGDSCAIAAADAARARLVIAADGRRSLLRRAADLPLHDLGAPIDVCWFRVPTPATPTNETQGYVGGGEMVVTIDRGRYFYRGRYF